MFLSGRLVTAFQGTVLFMAVELLRSQVWHLQAEKVARRMGKRCAHARSVWNGRPMMTSGYSLGARLRHDDPRLSLLSTRNRQVGVQVDIPLIFRPLLRFGRPYKPESHVIFGVNHDCGSQWFPDPRVRSSSPVA